MKSNKKVYVVMQGRDDETETFALAAYSSKSVANSITKQYQNLKMIGAVDSDTWCDVIDVPFYDDPVTGEVEV